MSPKDLSQEDEDSFGKLSSRSEKEKRKQIRGMSLQFSKMNFKAKN